MSSVLEVHDAYVAHCEINDRAAYDEIKKCSLYDDLLDNTHAIFYGKSFGFFEAITHNVGNGSVKLSRFVGPLHAIVKLVKSHV